MPDQRVIIARHNEDVSWVADIPVDWPYRIVQKGVDMPNHGRESSSYCWWIRTHYDTIDPDGTYAFLQGHPFEPHGVRLDMLRPVDRFTPLGRDIIRERFADGWLEGRWASEEWQVMAATCWRAWVSDTVAPPEEHRFVIGAQFLVPGRSILRHPATWWWRLGEWCKDSHRPWVIERQWQYVFDGPEYRHAG